MKTIEQKAKAYDEIIERAKTMLAAGEVMYGKENNASQLITDIIPDLKENGDERVKKGIIRLITRFASSQDRNKYIAYLEKDNGAEYDENRDFIIYHPLKNGKGEYECIPYSFYGSLTSFSEDKDLIDFLRTCFYTEEECNEWIEQQKEQKQEIISISEMVSKYRNTDEYDDDGNYKGKPVNCMIRAYEQGIRDTLLKVKDQKPALSEEMIKHLYTLARYIKSKGYEDDGEFLEGVANKLNRLCASWKSNEEQIPVTNDKQQECPYKDLILVKDFFGQYKRKCTLSNKACNPKECTYGEK